MPAWVERAIFWHLYPLGFVGAEIRPQGAVRQAHRLNRIVNWLDYALELGASALMLGPIFASVSHGYDTIDHFSIDPRLGDEKDFDALMAAAARRGISVVLDGVFNHVSRRHPAVQELFAQGEQGSRESWCRVVNGAPGGSPKLATFEGHDDLVVLNHDSPFVEDYVAGVMNHWLDRGAAGWRLDAAYAIAPSFWSRVLPRVREKHREAYIFGEVIHGDYVDFVKRSGVDSVTQYELWKAIWSSLNDRNFFEFAWALDRHNSFLTRFAPQTFIGNHDVTRLASRLTDERCREHAWVLLCTLGGAPSIYAGDEQGFHGIKEDRRGGDDAVRPEFPQQPRELPESGWSTYRRCQELIGLRRRHPWLHRAESRVNKLTNTALVYEVAHEKRKLMVALNLGDAVELPVPGMRTILAGRDASLAKTGRDASVRLAEAGWAILSPGDE
jgi:cyclomaltodextrinase